jgi:hypothetical protein
MTLLEKMELALIPVIGVATFGLPYRLPTQISLGHLLLTASVVLMLQSLLRDLLLLAKLKRSIGEHTTKVARCMCLESTVGITGVLAGISVLGLGINNTLIMTNARWTILIMVLMTSGFLIKDWLIESKPWRLVRDKNHMNIIFSWK